MNDRVGLGQREPPARAGEGGHPPPAASVDAPAQRAGVRTRRPRPGRRAAPEEMPRIRLTRGRLTASIVFVVAIAGFLYFVLPKLLGLRQTWNRIQHGNPWWLAAAALLEVLSFLSYILLFRAVFVRDGSRRIDLRVSYEITMAGLAATRLFASAGAGGIALTAWALRRAGMAPRAVASGMIAFTALVYAVFMSALVIVGLGLYLGVFAGENPFALTIAPAIFGAIVIALFLSVSLLPDDVDRFVARFSHRRRIGWVVARVAAAPAAAATGIRGAIEMVRDREWRALGGIGWWGFDIAVLWACFHAFGGSAPVAVVVMSYFIGMIGNLLPLPGGIGGVDGALIGSFAAFGIAPSLAVVAVLAYRTFAFWLPTLPGAVAYFQLRRTVHRWDVADSPSYT